MGIPSWGEVAAGLSGRRGHVSRETRRALGARSNRGYANHGGSDLLTRKWEARRFRFLPNGVGSPSGFCSPAASGRRAVPRGFGSGHLESCSGRLVGSI